MEEMDATAQLDSTRRKDGNIKSIRLIRTKEAAAEKEFLKEFFRGIGCSVNDAMCVSEKEMQREQGQESLFDVSLMLYHEALPEQLEQLQDKEKIHFAFNLEDGFFCLGGHKPIRRNMDTTVCKFEETVLDELIKAIWPSPNEAVIQTSIRGISAAFCQQKLFPYMQVKKTFRIVNMGEVLSLGINHYDIPDNIYIEEMLDALKEFQKQMKRIPVSVYSIYAQVNCARKIREIYNVLAPNSRIRAKEKVPIASVSELLEKLERIYEIDPNYIGAYHLAAYICQSDRRYWNDAYDYYQEAKCRTSVESKELYAFSIYQMGRYAQKYQNEKTFAEQYYLQAKNQWMGCYQAAFQSACYYAERKEFEDAAAELRTVISILSENLELEGDSDPERQVIKLSKDWKCLSLKEIQYLYKAYILMTKIVLNQQGESAVGRYIQKALLCIVAYQRALILKDSCDSNDYDKLLKYHEVDITVRALFVVLREMIGESSINEPIRNLVNEIISAL